MSVVLYLYYNWCGSVKYSLQSFYIVTKVHSRWSESELSYWMNWSWINEVYLWTGAYNEAIVSDKLVFIIPVFCG